MGGLAHQLTDHSGHFTLTGNLKEGRVNLVLGGPFLGAPKADKPAKLAKGADQSRLTGKLWEPVEGHNSLPTVDRNTHGEASAIPEDVVEGSLLVYWVHGGLEKRMVLTLCS